MNNEGSAGMKIFSTFTGVGGFEHGIQKAFNSVAGYQPSSTDEQIGQGRNGAPDERGGDVLSGHQPAFRASDRPAGPDQEENSVERNSANIASEYARESPSFVGYSEIDKPAISVYEKQFGGVKAYGDITKINADELPDFDCIVGGFPCQAFSIAGKRAGFDDTRGTLFFDLARILRAKQPRLFVFENVKGLLSHDGGKTFATIISTIDELGYDAQWQVINSKDWGVPQNRERIIIVGHSRGTPRPQVFPLAGKGVQTAISPHRQDIAIPVLTPNRPEKRQNGRRFKTDGEPAFTINTQDRHGIIQYNHPTHSNDRVYSPEGIGPTLNTMQGGNRQPFITSVRDGVNSGETTDATGVREVAGVPRQLDRVSDTQRYKMMGNAVTTNVVQAVFERIFSDPNYR